MPLYDVIYCTRRPGWNAWGNEVEKFGGLS